MHSGLKVVDADRHVMEPDNLWSEYLDPAFRSRIALAADGIPVVDGHAMQHPAPDFRAQPQWRETFADGLACNFDGASNLRAMDQEGVDVAVHFPTVGLKSIWHDEIDPAIAAAISRAYNRWLADFCSEDPLRLKGIALAPVFEPTAAIREIEHAAELGMVGVLFRPNRINGKNLSHPDYLEVYRAVAGSGMAMCLHEAANTMLYQAAADRWTPYTRHIATHPIEQMLACLQLTAGGILEQVPGLRAGHFEASCGWVPFWLERMDEHWEHYFFGGRSAPTTLPPSQLFAERCVVSTEAGEHSLRYVSQEIDPLNIVLSTDYPHSDAVGKFPDQSVGGLATNTELASETRASILWDSAARFFGFTDANTAVGVDPTASSVS